MKTFKLKFWTNKERDLREKHFIRNGSILQEKLISISKGKNLPIRVFSLKEVKMMSNFTNRQIIQESNFILYQGAIIDAESNRVVCIKKFDKDGFHDLLGAEAIIQEIVMAAQMSMHNNSLKLLGCCLETEFPIIVYEFPDQGCLRDYTYRNEGLLPWKSRLKIAWELSYALAYLHNGFSRPVIFRDLDARYVFLDKDYVAKLHGFYFSVLIPEGEGHVDGAVVGTNSIHNSAPEYTKSGRCTEKIDVHSFGVVLLLDLLVGKIRNPVGIWYRRTPFEVIKSYGSNVDGSMIVDHAISREIEENGKQEQLQEVFELAVRCSAENPDDRPDMIAVADELKKLLDDN